MHNYKPVSLFPVISKIFERAICDRMVNYLENNNVFNKNQLKGKNTIHAIFDFTNGMAGAVGGSECLRHLTV